VLGPSQLGGGDQLHRERVGPADSPPCPVEAVDPVVVERSDGALDHRGERDDVVDRPGALGGLPGEDADDGGVGRGVRLVPEPL